MKKLKILVSLLVIGFTFSLWSSYGWEDSDGLSIEDTIVVNSTQIDVILNKDISLNDLDSEDVKVMHDVSLESSELDIADARKVTINLKSSIKINTVYNLISVFWMDGSIDFETKENLDWESIMNQEEEWIKSINIVNPNTIEVFFFDTVKSTEVEFKILEDLNVLELDFKADSEKSFYIELESKLETESSYILMVLAANDLNWLELEIENWIFDFETSSELKNDWVSDETIDVWSELEWFLEDTLTEWEWEDLNSAWTEEDLDLILESTISEVAAWASETPPTWTSTNIMIFLTLWLTMIKWLTRRKFFK